MSHSHYIAMSGDYGCIPDYCESYDTLRDAASGLCQVFDRPTSQGKMYRTLLRDRYIDLNPRKDGASYAEIDECNCDDPNDHSDSYD